MTHTDYNPDALSPGDLVVDRDTDREDRGTAVVIRTFDTPADQHYVESLDATVAALNPTFPATDRVAEVIFEGHLERTVEDWRPMLRDALVDPDLSFYDLLREYRDAWGVPLREYAYPVSRLAPRPYCPTCWTRADYHTGRNEYECPTADCTANVEFGVPLNADDERPRPDDEWTLADVAANAMSDGTGEVPPAEDDTDTEVAADGNGTDEDPEL